MAIDFPASPTLNDVFTVGNVTYVWDGTKWTASVTGGISLDKIEEGNTSAEVIDTGSDGRFVVTTEGTERLRVTDTGRVGIGTASPNGNTNYGSLDLNGSAGGEIFFSSGGVSRGNIFNYSATPANLGIAATDASGQIIFNTGGYTERVRIDSSGRLGIGTSSPATKIQIQHADATASVFRLSRDGDNATTFDIDYNSSSGHVTLGPTLSGSATAFNLGFKVAGSTRMQIDGSGRVGIGTTSPSSALHVVGTALFNTAQSFIANSATGSVGTFQHNGTSIGDIGSGNQTLSGGSTGDVALTSRAGALVFGINTVEKARLDSSGRLLVGTSTEASNNLLVVEGSTTSDTGAAIAALKRGTDVSGMSTNDYLGILRFTSRDSHVFADIAGVCDATPGTNDYPGRLVFSTTADGASGPTERMRITRGGDLFSLNADNGIVSRSTLPAGTANTIFAGQHSAASIISGTNCFRVYTNGNVQNTNNSYGALSDIKLKENIVDATSQWNDVKTLQVRKYNFKEETGQPTHTQIGLVAQEVELVSPGLVTESPDRDSEGNDLGTTTKSVNYSVLYMKAVKALQEAIAKIETLEGMVAVNNITIDEQQHQLSTLAARLTALENA
jgi:hypothetical protein